MANGHAQRHPPGRSGTLPARLRTYLAGPEPPNHPSGARWKKESPVSNLLSLETSQSKLHILLVGQVGHTSVLGARRSQPCYPHVP